VSRTAANQIQVVFVPLTFVYSDDIVYVGYVPGNITDSVGTIARPFDIEAANGSTVTAP
jgi:hypothetical protein